MDIVEQINLLRKQKNAIILSHNYQIPEIQDIADFVGDSLGLSIQASKTNAEVIIFCGVDFMAENALILNPNKKVIVPDINAQCPMAKMIDPIGLKLLKEKNPNAKVVCYVNTPASVKAESDICCTSSNAIKVCRTLKEKDIIFIPDANLGRYVQKNVKEKSIILWDGYCPTHEHIKKEDILKLKEQHINAEVLVHPECTEDVIEISDFIYSTEGMLNHVRNSAKTEFIIGTEEGIIYRMKKETGKNFYSPKKAICPNMKKNTLEKVLKSLQTLEYRITLPEEIIKKAKFPLEKMMNVGRGD